MKTVKQHGTFSGYVQGCRCEVCTLANRNHARELRRKRGEPWGRVPRAYKLAQRAETPVQRETTDSL